MNIVSLFIYENKSMVILYMLLSIIIIPVNIWLIPTVLSSIVQKAPEPVSFPYNTFIPSMVLLYILGSLLSRVQSTLYSSFTSFYYTYLIKHLNDYDNTLLSNDNDIDYLMNVPNTITKVLEFGIYKLLPFIIICCIALYYMYKIDHIFLMSIVICLASYLCIIIQPAFNKYYEQVMEQQIHIINIRKVFTTRGYDENSTDTNQNNITTLSYLKKKSSNMISIYETMNNFIVFGTITGGVILAYHKFDNGLISKNQVAITSLFLILTLRLYISMSRELADIFIHIGDIRYTNILLEKK